MLRFGHAESDVDHVRIELVARNGDRANAVSANIVFPRDVVDVKRVVDDMVGHVSVFWPVDDLVVKVLGLRHSLDVGQDAVVVDTQLSYSNSCNFDAPAVEGNLSDSSVQVFVEPALLSDTW